METRTCKVCSQDKSIEEFYSYTVYRNMKTYVYRRHQCKPCENQRARVHHEEFKEKRKIQHREWRNKKLYNLSTEQYELLLEKQNYVCAICQNKCTSKPNLAVDHDHATGKVRGLLCANCNNGLGRFKDNVDWLSNAIEYLNEH